MKQPIVRARSETLLEMVPWQTPIQTNCTFKRIQTERISEKQKRHNSFLGGEQILSRTGASILGIVKQSEVDQIGSDGVTAIEWSVDVRVIVAPRVGDESEKKEDEGESDGCDRPVLLGPVPPPSERAEPTSCH